MRERCNKNTGLVQARVKMPSVFMIPVILFKDVMVFAKKKKKDSHNKMCKWKFKK